MGLKIEKVGPENAKPKPADESSLGFGRLFADHMLCADWTTDRGWHDMRIVPYGPLMLDPAALVLHYGQEIFEGLKAYIGAGGQIHLFRPKDNIVRMNQSATRLCMPELDVDDALAGIIELVNLEREWIPRAKGSSLYVRPTMIATEAALGVKVSGEYLFYVIVGPVGAYYPEGFAPTKILVNDQYVRAVSGGVGFAKTSANYAASLLAAEEAYAKGYTQVLWLDACDKRGIEEVGTSNIFFILEDEVVTPPLSGSILPGITRDSVLTLTRDRGLNVNERRITIDEVIDGIGSGKLKECFATGTAAVISPVGEINYQDQALTVGDGGVGELSQSLYQEILDIQYGVKDDPYGWVVKLD